MSRHGSSHDETYWQISRNVTGLSKLQNWVKTKSVISCSWRRIATSRNRKIKCEWTERRHGEAELARLFLTSSPSNLHQILQFPRHTLCSRLSGRRSPFCCFVLDSIFILGRFIVLPIPRAHLLEQTSWLKASERGSDDVFPVGWLQNHGWGSQTRGELITEHKLAFAGLVGHLLSDRFLLTHPKASRHVLTAGSREEAQIPLSYRVIEQ